MDDPVWDATVFSKNRDRLLDGEIASAFFMEVLAEAEAAGLVSDEHFTVDGTLLEAWASQKSFRRRTAPPDTPDDPGNPTVNFRGEARKNDTHQSTTDPDARLFKKTSGSEAKLAFLGHLLMENRHGDRRRARHRRDRDRRAGRRAGDAGRAAERAPHQGRRRQEFGHAPLCAVVARDGCDAARGAVS
jgi:hypothetical protein